MSDVYALFVVFGGASDDIISDVMFVVMSGTLGFVDGDFFWLALALASQGGIAKLDGFLAGHLFVFDETRFGEGLVAFFFLLWFVVGGVGGVTFFVVAMFAGDVVVVDGVMFHHYLFHATFGSGGNGADVKCYFFFLSLLSNCLTSWGILMWGWCSETPVLRTMMIVVMVIVVCMMILVTKGKDTEKTLLVSSSGL